MTVSSLIPLDLLTVSYTHEKIVPLSFHTSNSLILAVKNLSDEDKDEYLEVLLNSVIAEFMYVHHEECDVLSSFSSEDKLLTFDEYNVKQDKQLYDGYKIVGLYNTTLTVMLENSNIRLTKNLLKIGERFKKELIMILTALETPYTYVLTLMHYKTLKIKCYPSIKSRIFDLKEENLI